MVVVYHVNHLRWLVRWSTTSNVKTGGAKARVSKDQGLRGRETQKNRESRNRENPEVAETEKIMCVKKTWVVGCGIDSEIPLPAHPLLHSSSTSTFWHTDSWSQIFPAGFWNTGNRRLSLSPRILIAKFLSVSQIFILGTLKIKSL